MKLGARYNRQPHKAKVLDTPQIQAAAQFIVALDAGETPTPDTLETIRAAFQRMFEGEPPNTVWGRGKGRPSDNGFDSGYIVSVFIELDNRDPASEGGISAAKNRAIEAFAFSGDEREARRQIDRCWKEYQSEVEGLDTATLEQILGPCEITAL
ncbi:MAG: hypothetical protein ACI8WM_000380 [Burkholderiaceae bacterium]|jgi:hypothetical protein